MSITCGVNGLHILSQGGFICLNTGINPIGYTNDPVSVYQPLDCKQWSIDELYDSSPLECGGQMGVAGRNRFGYYYSIQFSLIYNPAVSAFDTLPLKWQRGFEAFFLVGDPDQYNNPSNWGNFSGTIPAATDGSTSIIYYYYWIPNMVIYKVTPLLDANGKKSIGHNVLAYSTHHIWAIPDDGDPTDGGTTRAGAYTLAISNKKVR